MTSRQQIQDEILLRLKIRDMVEKKVAAGRDKRLGQLLEYMKLRKGVKRILTETLREQAVMPDPAAPEQQQPTEGAGDIKGGTGINALKVHIKYLESTFPEAYRGLQTNIEQRKSFAINIVLMGKNLMNGVAIDPETNSGGSTQELKEQEGEDSSPAIPRPSQLLKASKPEKPEKKFKNDDKYITDKKSDATGRSTALKNDGIVKNMMAEFEPLENKDDIASFKLLWPQTVLQLAITEETGISKWQGPEQAAAYKEELCQRTGTPPWEDEQVAPEYQAAAPPQPVVPPSNIPSAAQQPIA